MARILELMSSDAGFETRRSAEQLRRGLGSGFEVQVRTIGSKGDSVPAAWRATRRECADLVHAWGTKALLVAAVATQGRLVFSPDQFMTGQTARWVRAVSQYRNVQVVCSTATMHKAMVENGISPVQCLTIRPGVDFGLVRARRSMELRKSLGLAEGDYVILAAGESTRAAVHRDAMWAAAILDYLDERYKVLLWGRGTEIRAVRRFASNLRQSHALRVAEEKLGRSVEFEELLPAADAVLVTADAPVSTLPICICMAAALPIVATVTPTVAELLEDRHNSLMVARRSPRAIARRILDLREDGQLQWSISDTARTEAYEHFSLTRFLDDYRRLYAGGVR